MITKISLAVALVSSSAIWAADNIQPLNVKPGLWESTTTGEMSGQPPVSPQAQEAMAQMKERMANMPHAERAKYEEILKKNAELLEKMSKPGGLSNEKPTVRRNCVKKEDLNRSFMLDEIAPSCARTVLAASSSKQEMRVQCSQDGMKQTFNFRLEVINSETFKGSLQTTVGDSAHTMNTNMSFSSRWIGPVCDSKDEKH